ncbi:hypothetical protein Tco_0761327 [Tanacetum coccineum]
MSSKKPSTTKETPKGKAPSKGSKTSKSASAKEPVKEPIAEVLMDDVSLHRYAVSSLMDKLQNACLLVKFHQVLHNYCTQIKMIEQGVGFVKSLFSPRYQSQPPLISEFPACGDDRWLEPSAREQAPHTPQDYSGEAGCSNHGPRSSLLWGWKKFKGK